MAELQTTPGVDPRSLLQEGMQQVFEPPADPNIRIWRYMDFTRLVNMFEEEGLFFRRADLFEDKFEGTMSEPLRDFLAQQDHSQSLESYREMMRHIRSCSFINSWHMNEA